MPPTTLEKILDRIKVDSDISKIPNSIARLLLEALVEQLRIRRLQMEDRVRSGSSQAPREQHRSHQRNHRNRQRETEEDGIITPAGWQPDPNPRFMVNGYVPVDGPPPRHPVPAPRLRTPPADRYVETDEIPTTPQAQREPSSGDHHHGRHRGRHHCSPSLRPSPKFKLKPSLTLGVHEHYKQCVKHYVADREKVARRELRHERRDARKKADAEDPHHHHHHGHHHREERGRRRERSPAPERRGPVRQAANSHHLTEAVTTETQAPPGENPHVPTYHPTPHSAAVEDIERWQAEVPHSPQPPSHHQSASDSSSERVYNHNQPVHQDTEPAAGAANEYYHPTALSASAHQNQHHRSERSRASTTTPGQYPVHVVPPESGEGEMQVRTVTAPPPYRSMATSDEDRFELRD